LTGYYCPILLAEKPRIIHIMDRSRRRGRGAPIYWIEFLLNSESIEDLFPLGFLYLVVYNTEDLVITLIVLLSVFQPRLQFLHFLWFVETDA
jgi:hypothetical protein